MFVALWAMLVWATFLLVFCSFHRLFIFYIVIIIQKCFGTFSKVAFWRDFLLITLWKASETGARRNCSQVGYKIRLDKVVSFQWYYDNSSTDNLSNDSLSNRQFIEPTVYRTTVYWTTVYRTNSLSNASLSNRQFIEPTVYRTDSLSNDSLSNDSLSNRQFIEPTVYRTDCLSNDSLSNDSLSNQQFIEWQFIEPTVYRTDSLSNWQFIETKVCWIF